MKNTIALSKPRNNSKLAKASPKRSAKPEAKPAVSPDHIMQLGLGFWASKTLLSAVELGVFTELAAGPLDAETLRTRLGLHARSALDFFDALVALRVLGRSNGRYANSPEAETFLDRGKPGYMGGILEMSSTRLYGCWTSLTEALRTGRPQNESKSGGDPFGSLYSTPEKLERFLSGMTGISLAAGRAIAQKFPWKKYRTFADVGAAQGAAPVQIALAHPHLKGLGYDLANVKPVFDRYVRANEVSNRVRFQAGDFFKDKLPAVDVIVMGHILHDWNLEQKKMLVKKAYDALPVDGALIVYEALIDDDRRENAFGLLMSLNMLIETPGGFDYTGADCQGWLRKTGFRQTRVEHLVGPDSMVVAIK